ncbi:hypothetical protein [Mahella australiensis]|uniref:hypothetical protein n=1 Tax=Mahella australiensis TaxID=252966 RepID=UPI0002DF634F|nr:hypothetical protein [Mahella australiensis]
MNSMTKKERVLRTINFQETDRIPVYDIIDNDHIREYYGGETITEENAWRLEYTAIRNALDMTRMLCVPNFHPGHWTDADGFVHFNDRYTSWVEKRPFDDVEGLKKWIEKDIDRKNNWRPDKAYVEDYRSYITKHKEGIGDDTVIIIESDVGLDWVRTMAGIELLSYLIADDPDLVSEWLEANNQAEIRRAKAIADPDLVPIMLTYNAYLH